MPTQFQSFNPGDLIEDTHLEQFINPINNLENGQSWYGEDAGPSSNTVEVDLDPSPEEYSAGMIVHFKTGANITGPATINLNSLGAKPLVKEGGVPMVGGELITGQIGSAIYDGSSFQLVSPVLVPTTTLPAPVSNVLVYSACTPFASTSEATMALPNFDFDAGKQYILEAKVSGYTNQNGRARVVLTGASTILFPGAAASSFVRPKPDGPSTTQRMILTSLSGVHSIDVVGAYTNHVELRIFEKRDDLVYTSAAEGMTLDNTVVTLQLADFVATAGRQYEITATAASFNSASASFAAYVTDGVAYHGIPTANPTGDLVYGSSGTGTDSVSHLMPDLDGTYSVYVRARNCGNLAVEIRDIT